MTKSTMHKPGALVPPHPKASSPAALPARTNNPGSHIGTTSAGHKIFSHARTHEYTGLSSKDHNEAANFHHAAAQAAKDPKMGAHHFNQTKMHMQAAGTAERKESRYSQAKEAISGKPRQDPFVIKKALEAGSSLASPGATTQGAALQSESLDRSMVNVTESDKKKKKKKWLERAVQEYATWGKREEFRTFMSEKMPHLTKGEIDAIGQTLALKKAMEAEEVLTNLRPITKALKFGSEADQAAVAASIAERAKNPPAKPAPKAKEPKLDSTVHSEVSHVEPYSDKHETVHLKSGHVLHGHPKGKYKAGDKVTAKPHLMGTHLMEHRKE